MNFGPFLIKISVSFMQSGGYTTANYIWDLMQARKITPSLPAVEAYYNGLKVRLLALFRIYSKFLLLDYHICKSSIWTCF